MENKVQNPAIKACANLVYPMRPEQVLFSSTIFTSEIIRVGEQQVEWQKFEEAKEPEALPKGWHWNTAD
ncbi:hypothetical protein HYALB_00013334 [Hymenoscyphus albidus]|uniref:Uncharacterized protein n=1 Tax=Hymenoscyphus albidus TaxID=595503 RepID=A0A9N9PXY4_9HELO|nr:hypothetical protein HYALB_00013334 [Hymenoscyphus albidus]